MRCIDKAGGFDSYVYHTPEKKLQSLLGSLLQQRMKDVVEKFDLTPPDKVVRLHRRPRSWDNLDEKDTEGGTTVANTDVAAKEATTGGLMEAADTEVVSSVASAAATTSSLSELAAATTS